MKRVAMSELQELIPNALKNLKFDATVAIFMPDDMITSDDIIRWSAGRLAGRYAVSNAFGFIFFEREEDGTMFYLEFLGKGSGKEQDV